MNRFLLLFALIALIACNANKPLGTKTKEPLSEYQLKKLTSELMDAEDFKKAEALLVDADSLVSLDPDLSFRLGICQFRQNRHSDANKSFARTIANNQTDLVPIDTYFYRGLSCYFNNDIDSSLFFYQFLKDTLTKLNDKKFLKIVDTEIIRCQTLDSLRKDSVIWEVTELDSISSPYSDHSPVVYGDESVMIFTSKRAGKKVPNTDGFYEDIYITSKVDNQWITPESISDSINTPLHEASIGLSADGQKLFIYKSFF